MIGSLNRRTGMLLLSVVLALTGTVAFSGIITLNVWNSYSLQDANGQNLADGSVVMVIGSKDSVADPMTSFGTNLIAASTTGDDIIIGWGTIYGNEGYFDMGGLTFDSAQVSYLYIRFFDTNTIWVEGYTAWGTSEVFYVDLPPYQEWWEQDFAPNHELQATNMNNFVVIPEPGALSYMLMAAAAAGWKVLRRKNTGKRGERMGER